MTPSSPAVGFVGLGAIGRPMVENLLASEVPVVAYDLDRDVLGEVADLGAVAADSLADLAGRVDVVGVCVPADQHVRAVLADAGGLFDHLPPGAVIGIHSTVLPETVRWAAEEAAGHDLVVVEAPVTGGFMAAAEGRSTFLLGGDPANAARLDPVLDACGEVRVHAGALGSASALKLCLNLQTYATFMGVFEAARLADGLGLELDALKAAMAANGQLNPFVENYLLLHEFTPETLADPEMQKTLEGYAAIIGKDLDQIRRLADDVGASVPTAELAHELARRVYFLEEGP